MRVFLSAGHHPNSPGAIAWSPRYSREHDLAHRIVSELADRLRFARPEVVPAVPLRHRIAYINRWSEPGDLAVEIHLNTAESRHANGVEVFYHLNSRTGRDLARMLVTRIADLGRRNRGAKTGDKSNRGRLGFLRRTKPWAALVEVEFISNPNVLSWLIDPQPIDPRGGFPRSMPGWEAAAFSMAEGLDLWARERA